MLCIPSWNGYFNVGGPKEAPIPNMIKLEPLVGKSPHHIQSTRDFASKVRKATLPPGECLSSYDVTALFTSVPIDPALNIINESIGTG